MTACILTSDLTVSSHVVQAGREAGIPVNVAMNVQRLLTEWTDGETSLVILDLNHPGLDTSQVLASLGERSGNTPAVIAFGPHVHAARLATARDAGCAEVLTRGQFHTHAAAILKRYADR